MQVNPWALDKHDSIKHLVLLLAHEPGFERLDITADAELDERAVRLRFSGAETSAYVYTYGQQQQHYGVHLEYPELTDNLSLQDVIHENLVYERLLNVLSMHLE